MTEAPAIRLESDPEAAAQELAAGLKAWNDRVSGPTKRLRFVYGVRSADGTLTGGIHARVYRDELYVDDLWLRDDMRGQGLGSRLLALAEQHARAEGCRVVSLDTMNWQARPFYERHGYACVLEQSYEGGRFVRYFMRKDLLPPSGQPEPHA
jgi:GNAT superfamily N-acetyltransferase